MKEFEATEIGMNAGQIWNELNKKMPAISIQQLCHKLSITFEDAVLAIGWLAKENNIIIKKKDGRLMLLSKESDFAWG